MVNSSDNGEPRHGEWIHLPLLQNTLTTSHRLIALVITVAYGKACHGNQHSVIFEHTQRANWAINGNTNAKIGDADISLHPLIDCLRTWYDFLFFAYWLCAASLALVLCFQEIHWVLIIAFLHFFSSSLVHSLLSLLLFLLLTINSNSSSSSSRRSSRCSSRRSSRIGTIGWSVLLVVFLVLILISDPYDHDAQSTSYLSHTQCNS